MRIAPILIGVALLGLLAWATVAYAAPLYRVERSILPEITSTFYLGSSSPDRAWAGGIFDSLTLGGVTRTTWPSGGGGGGSISTSTALSNGLVVFATGIDTIGNDAGFAYSSSLDRLTVPYASTTAISVGSDFLTDLDGTGLSLSAGGVLSTTLGTSIDISDETNLAATYPLVLTGDTLSSALSTTSSNTWGGTQTFTNQITGSISGNAGTASALAANGANCSAGSFPLGVDASGAVETCTDAWTEAENTAAAYAPQSRTLTIAGTANQITSSAGAQDLSANRTWTLSLPSHVIFPGSASTTQLSVTSRLYVGGSATTTIGSDGSITMPSGSTFTKTGVSDGCATWSSGALSSTGSACGSGGGSISGWATTTAGGVVLLYPTLGTEDVVFGGTGAGATSSAPFWFDVSESVQYIGTSSNKAAAWKDSAAQFGPTSYEWTLGYDLTNNDFVIASGTELGTNNAFSIDKNLLTTIHGGYVSQASSTVVGNFTLTGTAKIGTLSGVLIGTSGTVSAGADGTDYTLINASTCTNQVHTAVTAAGVFTCSSINSAYWSGTDLSVANGGTGLSTFGGNNHILYTSAADTLTSEAAFTYTAGSDLLTVVNASTTNVSASYASSTLAFFGTLTATILNGLTSIDATAESTIEAAIDTLANLNSITIGGDTITDLVGTGLSLTGSTLGVNLGANFAWTGVHDFGAGVIEIANGTGPTVDATGEVAIDTDADDFIFFGSAVKRTIPSIFYKSFSYSTSTTWTGTTTIPLGPAPRNETWRNVWCFTDASFVATVFYDGTNRMNYSVASTTVGTTTLSSNNTFVQGEKRYVDIGTTTTATTKQVSCTVAFTYDAI